MVGTIQKYKVTKKDISFLLENPWIELEDLHNLKGNGPIYDGIFDNEEDPPFKLLRMLRNPDYFSFTCKHLFNVNLLPFQGAILKELWIRPFPMLIGTRGLGKCENGKSIIMADDRVTTIEDFVGYNQSEREKIPCDNYLFGENGFKKVEYSWDNGITDNIKIKSRFGYHLEGTHNHPVRVVDGAEIVWKNLDQIKVGDRIVIDRTESWIKKTNDIPADLAYLFGALVGDGGYTVRGSIGFTTADECMMEVLNPIALKYFGKVFRKQESADYQYLLCSVDIWDKLFSEYGFESYVCEKKCFPKSILSAPKESVAAFISGLMDTDGTASKDGLLAGFCSKSVKLAKMLHFILTRFGIISNLNKRWNTEYERYYYYITIFGKNAILFNKKIGFKLPRKDDRLSEFAEIIKCNTNVDTIPLCLIENLLVGLKHNNYKTKTYEMTYERLARLLARNRKRNHTEEYQKLLSLFNKNYYYDTIIEISNKKSRTYDVHIPEDHSFVSNGLISHNSFLLGTYAMLRALLDQGSKIVICGSGFRQAKLVFQYAENIWNTSPILRDICKGEHKNGVARDQDQWSIKVGRSVIFAIPLGDGSKIRGFRATDIIMDEFASVDPNIYQNVIQGFAAVSSDPVENVKKLARNKLIKKYNLDLDTDDYIKPNRQILSGTAYYQFNHFATYWKRWRAIIQSKGDPQKIAQLFPEGVEDGFNHRDYSIIRIPVKLIPEGYMDAKAVGKAKASSHIGNYMLEYGAVFVSDTDGFFKRSLVESCVAKGDNISPPVGPVQFSSQLIGNPKYNYVIAIDPASEADNFAVIVLELHDNHKRIVYCWTTNKARYNEVYKKKLTQDNDFYVFCAKKIRELRYKFPASRIAMDEEGGGRAVAEALRDPKNLNDVSEQLILPIIEEDKEKPTDNVAGEHILELINFSRYDWYSEAHHTLRKDFEDKTLLFPFYDSVSIGLAGIEDNILGRDYDTLEDCTIEIEELKDELATITITRTPNGNRDRWDVPETKLPGGKKGRQRKDRFTALLIANMAARGVQMKTITPPHKFIGGFASNFTGSGDGGPLFDGPQWYKEQAKENNYYDF